MEINKDNYEIFILDYHEGRLNHSEEQALFAFLDLHPELKAEFDSFENISFTENETIRFELKESLKKNDASTPVMINLSNYKSCFIAAGEGDLTNAQQKQLEVFLLQHPDLQNDFRLFQAARLTADQNIIYEQKQQLKKYSLFTSAININKVYQNLAVAASFLILISISSYFFYNYNTPGNTLVRIPQSTLNNTASIPENKSNTSQQPKMAVLKDNISIPDIHNTGINTKENTAKPAARLQTMQELASIPLNKLNEEHAVSIINESRNENAMLCNLLVLAEDASYAENSISTKPKETEKDNSRFSIDESIYNENALSQLGGFIRYYAVNSISGAEKLSNFASNTFQTVENKMTGK